MQRPLRNVQANPSASPIAPEEGQSAPTRGVGQDSPCFGQGWLNWSLLSHSFFSFRVSRLRPVRPRTSRDPWMCPDLRRMPPWRPGNPTRRLTRMSRRSWSGPGGALVFFLIMMSLRSRRSTGLPFKTCPRPTSPMPSGTCPGFEYSNGCKDNRQRFPSKDCPRVTR